MIELLKGKKTYIVMFTAFVFNVGVIAGWWTVDNRLWAEINALLGALGLTAMRAGMKKEE